MASSISRSIELSMTEIEDLIAVEVATRSMAGYNKAKNFSCGYFFESTDASQDQKEIICYKYNFSNLDDLNYFVSATWFN